MPTMINHKFLRKQDQLVDLYSEKFMLACSANRTIRSRYLFRYFWIKGVSMKIRTLVAIVCLGLSQLVAAFPAKPASCPTSGALKGVPFLMAQEDTQTHRGYIAFTMSNYQTQDQWGFVLGFIQANNPMEAVLTANKVLPTVQGSPQPMPIDQPQYKGWACLYGVEGNYQAIAITPLNGGFKNDAVSLLR